ncbi:MAG: decarboxylating 6-phosphogluconate dehydrogenase [Gammaproteobacteria bacterium]|nr:decarboxylating 6-phosphogluconate dehydrogenase [Gammaproteobacteria bacterium]
MVGLGRMGASMLRRLARAGLPVCGFDVAEAARAGVAGEPGVAVGTSLAATIAMLRAPRAVWVMLPAGAITTQTIDAVAGLLSPGDVILDGGNADYHDTLRQAASLEARGLHFIDVGVSGGVWGLAEGYGLMFGGPNSAVTPLLPVFQALAPAADRGWVHCGPTGSGHYTKMVHNGIEYGAMQAYAEGFALLHAKREFALDVAAIAEAWRHGTVVRSWLLDLAAGALRQDPLMDQVAPLVADSGEGRWTVREGLDLGVPLPVTAAALNVRLASQGRGDYGARFLARLRNAFGGHAVGRADRPGS